VFSAQSDSITQIKLLRIIETKLINETEQSFHQINDQNLEVFGFTVKCYGAEHHPVDSIWYRDGSVTAMRMLLSYLHS